MKIRIYIKHDNKILVKIFIFLNNLKIMIWMTVKYYKCETHFYFIWKNKGEQCCFLSGIPLETECKSHQRDVVSPATIYFKQKNNYSYWNQREEISE